MHDIPEVTHDADLDPEAIPYASLGVSVDEFEGQQDYTDEELLGEDVAGLSQPEPVEPTPTQNFGRGSN
jgi:hypothetical protein